MSGALTCQDLRFGFPGEPTPAIRGVHLQIETGERVALMGQSGSGKSTLLHLLAGILEPDSGSVLLDGEPFSALDLDERARIRLRRFGFVFQFSELLPELSLRENIELPLRLAHERDDDGRIDHLLSELAISDVADKPSARVSGGQRQRAAIARALAHRPGVVFADEPTGALDHDNGEAAMRLLLGLSHDLGATVVVVTHDERVASALDRRLAVRDGLVTS